MVEPQSLGTDLTPFTCTVIATVASNHHESFSTAPALEVLQPLEVKGLSRSHPAPPPDDGLGRQPPESNSVSPRCDFPLQSAYFAPLPPERAWVSWAPSEVLLLGAYSWLGSGCAKWLGGCARQRSWPRRLCTELQNKWLCTRLRKEIYNCAQNNKPRPYFPVPGFHSTLQYYLAVHQTYSSISIGFFFVSYCSSSKSRWLSLHCRISQLNHVPLLLLQKSAFPIQNFWKTL